MIFSKFIINIIYLIMLFQDNKIVKERVYEIYYDKIKSLSYLESKIKNISNSYNYILNNINQPIQEVNFMNFIINFIRKEEERKQIEVVAYSNGVKYVIENDPLVARTFHTFFKPLNNEQILKLEDDVNNVQKAKYVFPKWYIEFLKTTNGLNIFLNSISLFGEQTPIVENKKIGKTESLLERENIEWLAPYNLRYSNSVKFSEEAQNRWLVIGNYKYDGTHIAWDFKTKK